MPTLLKVEYPALEVLLLFSLLKYLIKVSPCQSLKKAPINKQSLVEIFYSCPARLDRNAAHTIFGQSKMHALSLGLHQHCHFLSLSLFLIHGLGQYYGLFSLFSCFTDLVSIIGIFSLSLTQGMVLSRLPMTVVIYTLQLGNMLYT